MRHKLCIFWHSSIHLCFWELRHQSNEASVFQDVTMLFHNSGYSVTPHVNSVYYTARCEMTSAPRRRAPWFSTAAFQVLIVVKCHDLWTLLPKNISCIISPLTSPTLHPCVYNIPVVTALSIVSIMEDYNKKKLVATVKILGSRVGVRKKIRWTKYRFLSFYILA